MWCTRWYLPLILLPLPTAPPYFLALFLLSLTLHARPCFYCVVLLCTLSISSCYWQPFPIDSPLTTPWADNITTFAHALSSTLPANYSKPLPPVMRAADRCWCELASGVFFEPFNVTNWEYVSVHRLSQKLLRDIPSPDTHTPDNSSMSLDVPANSSVEPASNFLAPLWSLYSRISRSPTPSAGEPEPPQQNDQSQTAPSPSSSPESHTSLPLIRTQYDLRPYGLGLILDLGWSR